MAAARAAGTLRAFAQASSVRDNCSRPSMRSPRTGPLTGRPAMPPIGGRVVSRVGAAR